MKHSFDLTIEVRSTDGTAAEFYQSTTEALRFIHEAHDHPAPAEC